MNHENELTEVKVSFIELGLSAASVTVEHIGFKEDNAWNEAFDWHQMAWTGVLDSLKSALEKGEGNLCCQP